MNCCFWKKILGKDAIKPIMTEHPIDIYKTVNMSMNIIFSTAQAEILGYYAPYFKEIYAIDAMDSNFTLKFQYKGKTVPVDSDVRNKLMHIKMIIIF